MKENSRLNIIRLIATIIILTCFWCALVGEVHAEGDDDWEVYDDIGCLLRYNGSEEEVVIPEYINGKRIHTIGIGAFSYNSKVKKIIMPDSITDIWQMAFSYCENLEEIELSSNLENISCFAFEGCSSLKSIELPDTVKNLGYCNGYNDGKVFYNCSSLTNVKLSKNMTSIELSTFEGCTSLETIEIPDNVTSIAGGAFYGCTSLKNVKLSNNLQRISSGAFGSCENLKSIDIPDSVTVLNGSFYDCVNLSSVSISSNIKKIGPETFKGCSSLNEIEIPTGVTSIGAYAFKDCSSLKKIVLPNSVTDIENGAFYNCNGLTDIKFSNQLTTIGEEAFLGCTELTSIEIPDSVVSLGVYLNSNQEHGYSSGAVFKGCSSLKSVKLSNQITSIENSTFYGCFSLENIELPNSIKTIGESAFSNCSSLTDIKIPYSVKSIENQAFSWCKNLNRVVIFDSVESISDSAFYYYNSLDDDRPLYFLTVKDSYAEKYANEKNIRVVYMNTDESVRFFQYDAEHDEIGPQIFTYTYDADDLDGKEFPDILIRTYKSDIDGFYPTPLEVTIHDRYKNKYCGGKDYKITTDANGEYILPKYTISFEGFNIIPKSYDIDCYTELAYSNLTISADPIEFYDIKWNELTDVKLDTISYENDTPIYNYQTSDNYLSIKKVSTNGSSYKFYKDAECTMKYDNGWKTNKGRVVWVYIKISKENRKDLVVGFNISHIDNVVTFKDMGKITDVSVDFDIDELINNGGGMVHKHAIACVMLSGLIENSYTDVKNGLKQLNLYGGENKISSGGLGDFDGTIGRVVSLRDYVLDGKKRHIVTVVAKGTNMNSIDDVAYDLVPCGFEDGALQCVATVKALLAENGLSIDDPNTYFLVTGHSLGGAVANITAKKLIDEGCSLNHITCYTFASPLTSSKLELTAYGKYPSIHNYINNIDIVPNVGSAQTLGLVLGAIGGLRTKIMLATLIGDFGARYGHDISYGCKSQNDDFKYAYYNLQKQSWDNGNAPIIRQHYVSTYLALLLSKTNFETTGTRRIIYVHCPVDVELVDGNGNVCLKIVNNEITEKTDDQIEACVIDDKKIIIIDEDSDYKLNVTGYDNGNMGIEVIDYNYDGTSDQIVAEKAFDNISINNGKTITCDVDDSINTEDIKLLVVDENGKAIKEVGQDGSETDIANVNPGKGDNSEGSKDQNKSSEANASDNSTINPAVNPAAPTPPADSNALAVGTEVTDSSNKAKYVILDAATDGSGKAAFVAPVSKKNTKFVVPDTVKLNGITYKVTEIKANAFKNNKKLKIVTIGSNVEKIGKNAFCGCKFLSSINIKTKKLSAKNVGKNVFAKIAKKPTVKVPKSKKKAYEKWLYKKGLTKKAKVK